MKDIEISNVRTCMIDKDTDFNAVFSEMFGDILKSDKKYEYGFSMPSPNAEDTLMLVHYLMLVTLANMREKDRSIFIKIASSIMEKKMLAECETDNQQQIAKLVVERTTNLLKEMLSDEDVKRGDFELEV